VASHGRLRMRKNSDHSGRGRSPLRAAARGPSVVDCARCGLGCQRSFTLRNRQRVRPLDVRLLRRIVQDLLHEAWPDGSLDLGIYVVTAGEISRLNETFLHHKGWTDVLTFDYAEPATRPPKPPALLHGEVFVCLDAALSQARRFHTTWQSELVRYIVHGLLHLLGYDDLDSRASRQMKPAEDALLHHLARRFDFQRVSPANK
jgi:probable rRNA maturation factor